jgi:uncharacterized oligopeptide transporter (OPT) family protein
MLLLIFWALCGIAAAMIASSKSRSVGGWFFGGLLFGPLGVLIVACLSPITTTADEGGRPCPHCAETIKRAAVVCRFCGRDVEAQATAPTALEASGAY